MLSEVVEVRVLEGYQLYLRFGDGAEGVIDVEKIVPFDGVFAALRERASFEQVCVHPELGTICWPNGAYLDPDVLHSLVTGFPVEVESAG